MNNVVLCPFLPTFCLPFCSGPFSLEWLKGTGGRLQGERETKCLIEGFRQFVVSSAHHPGDQRPVIIESFQQGRIIHYIIPGFTAPDFTPCVFEEGGEIIPLVKQVCFPAGYFPSFAGMAVNIECVFGMFGGNLFQNFDPTGDQGSGGSIDIRVSPIENQVSHVHDIRFLEVNRYVAAGMRPPVIPRRYRLASQINAPGSAESRIGQLRLPVRIARSGLSQQFGDSFVGHDSSGFRPENNIAGGVIPVMVGVYQEVDGSAMGSLIDPAETLFGGLGKLAVDDDDRFRDYHPPDRSSAAEKNSHRIPQVFKGSCSGRLAPARTGDTRESGRGSGR